MTEELKACPFCGGEASAEGYVRYTPPLADAWWADGSAITDAFYVNCVKCGAVSRSGLTNGYQTRVEAIAAWNRRKPALAVDDQVEALVAQLASARGWIKGLAKQCGQPHRVDGVLNRIGAVLESVGRG